MLLFAGAPDIASPIQFSLETTFKVDPPVFTLTCVSTVGPASTVNWTRDGIAVSYDDNHVLTQIVTDQLNIVYSNVLTVIGREPGNYTCSVTNDRGNDSSQVVLVEGTYVHEYFRNCRYCIGCCLSDSEKILFWAVTCIMYIRSKLSQLTIR